MLARCRGGLADCRQFDVLAFAQPGVTWLGLEGAEEMLVGVHKILRPGRAGAVWIA